MSRTVDERVVEMRFDNKQFEQGAKETMGTLDKLKEALKFSKSGEAIDNLGKSVKNVDLTGMAKSIQALEDRFSTLGIVGMRVIGNITDSIMGLATKGIGFLTDSIVSGGLKRAMNIENAHFQLQSLLKDEELVQNIMDSASKSVDGTAYSYDVAAKAASMFAASGVKAGEQMDKALMAMADTTASVNGDYESMSRIFTKVAGQGRLMGDNLMELSTRGMNAAAIVAKYFKEVRGEANITEGDIRDMVSKGKIDFQTFIDAMEYSYEGSAKRANETFNGAMSNVKAALARIGAGFFSPLIEQNSEVVRLLNAMRVRINDVKKALVFDKELGNVNALSKQFTDSVLGMAGSVADFLENADLTKPMQAFYYSFEAVKNVVKGIGSVLSPVGKAFKEVFLTFSGDDVVSLTAKIEQLTSKLKLSDKGAQNLHDAFKGVFDIIKLLGQGFIKLVSAIIPVSGPITTVSGGLLELVGSAGRGLTAFSEWVRQSPIISKAYHVIADGISTVMSGITYFITHIKEYATAIYNMEGTQKVLSAINGAFEKIGTVAGPYVEAFVKKLKEMKDKLKDFVPKSTEDMVNGLSDGIGNLVKKIGEIDLSHPSELFSKFGDILKDLLDTLAGNKGIDGFITNMKNFFNNMKEAFTFDALFDNIDSFKERVGGFIDWIKKNIGPAFEDVSFGGLLGAGGLFFFLKEIAKIVKTFNGSGGGIAGSFKEVLGSVKGALTAWQEDLKADQIKKIAEAILILSAALVLLSFADMEQLVPAAAVLTSVATALGFAFSQFSNMIGKWNTTERVLNTFSKGLSKTMKKLGTALEIRAIGKAVKDFATAIVEIALAIAGVALMYEKYPDSMDKAVKLVAEIAGGMLIVIAAMSLLGKKLDGGMTQFQKAASGVLMLSAAVLLVVTSIEKLFKIDLPSNYDEKLTILAGIFAGLGILTIAIGVAARLSGGNSTKQAGTILALTVMLYTMVKSIEKLFKMDLPADYDVKLGILAGIFIELAGVMIAIGIANRLAGGTLKAATSILAVCAFLVVAVGSLMILATIPENKLLKGATALGAVLIALGVALAGAGTITTKDTWKSVLAMTVAVGVITASLSVLSMIPWSKLLVAAVSLGGVLLALATALNAAGKIEKKESIGGIVAMIGVVAVIGYALYELSEQPWGNILASAASISAVMLTFGEVLKIISKSSGLKIEKITAFLAATLAFVPIGVALYALSEQPWEGLLAAAVALSGTLLALSGALAIASIAKPNLMAIASLLAATVSLGLVAFALYELATNTDPNNLLTAAIALGALMLELSAVLVVCGLIGTLGPAAFIGIAALDVLLISLLAILGVVGEISDKVNFAGGVEVFKLLGEALGGFGGAIISGLGGGVAEAIEKIGTALSNFAENAKPFFKAISEFGTSENVAAVGYLAAAILALTVAELVNGIASFITGGDGMAKMGKQLSDFVEAADPFFKAMPNINPQTAEAVKTLADMMLTMTKAELVSAIAGFASRLLGGGKSLSDFGQELSDFAGPIVDYAKKVANVDFSAVEGSVNAAKILMDLYEGLPKSGGWMQKVMGETMTLTDFAKELQKFGPSIVSYAKTVAGVDFSGVEGSANAAKIMMDLYEGLPKSGGWMQVIMGEQKTLSEFGKELAAFGPYLASYGRSVQGITAETVQSSAEAAQILIDLSNNLGTNNSLWQNIFGGGKQSLSEFGDQLVSFGQSLSNYASYISGISTDQMHSVYQELTNLVSFANSVSGLDTKGMTGFVTALETMGKTGVDKFVAAFTDSSSKVTNAITSMLNSAISAITSKDTEFNSKGTASANQYLTGIKNKYGEAESTGLTLAVKALAGLQQKVADFLTKGTASANQYLTGIKNKYGEAQSTGTTIASKVLIGITSKNSDFLSKGVASALQYLTGIKNKYGEAQITGLTLAAKVIAGIVSKNSEFNAKGAASAVQYLTGIQGKYSDAQTTGTTFAGKAITGINSKLAEFLTEGTSAANNYIKGIADKNNDSNSAGNTLANNAYTGLKSLSTSMGGTTYSTTYDSFKSIGANAGQGFIDGIKSKEEDAAKAGKGIASAAYDAAKKELDEHSPSKKMAQVGNFAGLGFVNKLMTFVSKAYKVGGEVGKAALDGISSSVELATDIINSGFDINPQIVPTVDLSNVRKSSNDISKMFNDAVDVTVGNVQATASVMKSKPSKSDEEDTDKSQPKGDQYFTFEQNNYSPKSLSRLDIYRDSKNLFSKFKQEVETV